MAVIQGIVKDKDKPLDGVILQFKGKENQDKARVRTNAAGEYRTKVLEAGDYLWTAQKDGYIVQQGEITALLKGDKIVDVKTIVLACSSSICGRATDPAGAGVQGAKVKATDTQRKVAGQAQTSDTGYYTITNLSAGTYKVTVQAPAGFREPDAATVRIKKGQDTVSVDFLLTLQTGSISGRIMDQAGNGIHGAEVTATNVRNKVSPPAVTDRNGAYIIRKLAPGAYTVTVKAWKFQVGVGDNVNVQADQDTVDINFKLAPVSIYGLVTDGKRAPVANAQVIATDEKGQDCGPATTDNEGFYTFQNLAVGAYTVRVDTPVGYRVAHNVKVNASVTADGIDFSLDVIYDFLCQLDNARFSLESLVSEDEANQAERLFSVVTLMLAGLSQLRVGNEDKIDILGVLNLYYGLQNGSLRDKFAFANASDIWGKVEGELNRLAKDLERLQSDVVFLNREAKRQFNMGISNNVLGNIQFPTLFKRYVEIGNDTLLSIDIRAEEQNKFFDRTKLAQAYDLLKDLKGLILQIVRSLSKYGTAVTRRVNEDWSGFLVRALEVLAIVSQNRVTPDLDEKNTWSVLAELTNKNRETEIAPYVVLSRQGGKLLKDAMEIYAQTQNQLDNFDQDHLRDLFQPQGQQYWTDRIRTEATVIKRYSLTNWR